MQHRIDIDKYGPRGQTMASAIQSCVHCGFCLATCPTYKVLGEEMDSPRGRIYLMKEVLEEKINIEDAQPYLDRCLGCIGCMSACPSGVRYDELIVSYRAFSEPQRRRSVIDTMSRRMITETLPYPSRFRKAVASSKVGKLFKGAMPEKLSAMLGLVPTDLPDDKPLPPFYPAKGKRRAKVALLSGCVQTVLDPDINWATLRVLSENGVETVIPQGQGCCGSIMMHIGEEERAKKLARQNLQVFRLDEVDAIITNAAGCGSGMKEYGLLFKGLPEETVAEQFAHKVRDISVFLDQLGFKAPGALPEPLTVAYQDACHLLHAQGIRSAPRNLLASIPNLTLLELGDGGLCCGSAGTYNIEHPDIAHQLGQRKVQHILNTGAQAVVSGNIGCLTQIQTHLAERGVVLPLYHTVKLLDWAYRQTT